MILSSALVYSTQPPVSVYSTGIVQIIDSGFSWEFDYLHFPLVHALKVLSGSIPYVDLPPYFILYTL